MERLDQLLRGKRGGRMLGAVDVHDSAALVRDHDEHEKDAARQRRDGKEVHRGGGGEMVREERLRLRPPGSGDSAWAQPTQRVSRQVLPSGCSTISTARAHNNVGSRSRSGRSGSLTRLAGYL